MFNEKALGEALYASLSKSLKERMRPHYPTIDLIPEEEALELGLAFNRHRNLLRLVVLGGPGVMEDHEGKVIKPL